MHVSLPECVRVSLPECVCVFVSAFRIPSGEISTLDRMLASGLGAAVPTVGVAFAVGVWLGCVVGVPGEGRDTGLTPLK